MNVSGDRPAPGTPVERQQILEPYRFDGLLDDPRLQNLTRFAAALLDSPVALVTLIEDERQLFLARTGVEFRETPREISFCTHAIRETGLMVVPDATADPRFAGNPLVTGDLAVRFYAGAPLRGSDGTALGTLCVIDSEPRGGVSPLQEQGLLALAESVVTLFEGRRSAIAGEQETVAAQEERDERGKRFATLADTMPQMVWSTRPDGFHDYYNKRWYEFTGMPEGSTDGEAWSGMFHPEDQARAWAQWSASLASGEPYEIEYRLRDKHGAYRWVLGRALPMRDDQGRITRWFGTCTDIHDQKIALEQRELISHELSHRIKNIFSVIAGLIGLSSRTHPELKPLADDLRGRVTALGKAHDFVRPHSEASRPQREQSSLFGMLEDLLAPYAAAGSPRIEVTGTDCRIDDRSATPLALLFHELATNAAKYGALSTNEGRVTIDAAAGEDEILLRWTELGGPTVPIDGVKTGFGFRLIAMSVEQQLGGKLERQWAPQGLMITVAIPSRSMRRRTEKA